MRASAWIDLEPDSTTTTFNKITPGMKQKSSPRIWRNEENVREDTFQIDGVTLGGKYQLCFQSLEQDRKELIEEIKRGKMERQKERAKQQQQQQRQGGGDPIINLDDETDDDIVNLNDDSVFDEPIAIGFNIRIEYTNVRTLPEGEMGPDAKRALSLVDQMMVVQRNWENLLDHYDFTRNREALHERLTQQISDRVVGWSIVEAFLVVSMSIGQVMYWKKFFEQRRYL